MLCKKDIVSFLFLHKTYVLDILIKRGDSNKYPKHMLLEFLIQYSTIFLINCHQWAEVSWHLNCHYNEFCRCIECWYEEGWLYIATDMCANENQNQFAHPRSLIGLSFLRMKNFVSLTIPNASNEDSHQTECAVWSESSLGTHVRRYAFIWLSCHTNGLSCQEAAGTLSDLLRAHAMLVILFVIKSSIYIYDIMVIAYEGKLLLGINIR